MGDSKNRLTAVYKDKQYLVFELNDGKTVKYDFAEKKAIGKRGCHVKDLKSQLSGITMYDLEKSCKDPNYAKFLRFVQNQGSRSGYDIYNIGTILKNISRWSIFEQFFSAGLERISWNFAHTIEEVPKGLLNICKNYNVELTNGFFNYYVENPNGYYVAFSKDYVSLTKEDVYTALCRYTSVRVEGTNYKYIEKSYFNILTQEYGYNATSLMEYLDFLQTYEALEVRDAIRELYDYVKMSKEISDKFDKYPRHFLTTHKIAVRNYNRLKKNFDERKFEEVIDTSLECTIGDYVFIYPKSTQEIKDEAVAQNNCVASYIDRVLNGVCHIMFMRKKTDPAKSLVTLEIRNNRIVQSKRKFNYPTTEKDNIAIAKWNERYKIKESIS